MEVHGADTTVNGAFPGKLALHEMDGFNIDAVRGVKADIGDELAELAAFIRGGAVAEADDSKVGGKGAVLRF